MCFFEIFLAAIFPEKVFQPDNLNNYRLQINFYASLSKINKSGKKLLHRFEISYNFASILALKYLHISNLKINDAKKQFPNVLRKFFPI
jgi:hypothetical protein